VKLKLLMEKEMTNKQHIAAVKKERAAEANWTKKYQKIFLDITDGEEVWRVPGLSDAEQTFVNYTENIVNQMQKYVSSYDMQWNIIPIEDKKVIERLAKKL